MTQKVEILEVWHVS